MISEKEAARILRKHSPNKEVSNIVLSHSRAVQKAALNLARGIDKADKEFIKTASLLHDIGRFSCPPGKDGIRHGIVGAAILRKEGLRRHALAAERHVGAGISKADIKLQGLKLPLKDYIPRSIEEKIICHADNMVEGSRFRGIRYAVNRFRNELGERYAKRIICMAREISSLKHKL